MTFIEKARCKVLFSFYGIVCFVSCDFYDGHCLFFTMICSQNLQVNLPADLSTGYYRHLLCIAHTLRPARKHTHFGGCQREEAFKRQYPG